MSAGYPYETVDVDAAVRYTPEVVDQAILITAIAASNKDFHASYGKIADELGLKRSGPGVDPALTLALAAWDKCNSLACIWPWALRDAEAEALLRSGWQP